MPNVPDCPKFEEVNICGVVHTLTPSPKDFWGFYEPVERRLNLWGFEQSLDSMCQEMFPDEACPVEYEIYDKEREEYYPRWNRPGIYPSSGPYGPDEHGLDWRDRNIDKTGMDAAELLELERFLNWKRRQNWRNEAVSKFTSAVADVVSAIKKNLSSSVMDELMTKCPTLHQEMMENSRERDLKRAEWDAAGESLRGRGGGAPGTGPGKGGDPRVACDGIAGILTTRGRSLLGEATGLV